MTKSKINSNYTVPFRRKRTLKTNYKKRLSYLKSGLTRLVVRLTSKDALVQFVNYGDDGDKVLVTINYASLRKLGWKHHGGNVPTAYLCGLLAAKKASGDVTSEVIADFGMCHALPKSRIFAAVKGALDGGANIIVDDKSLPDENRISGKVIMDYAKTSGKKNDGMQFSKVIKDGVKPENIVSDFESVKSKILGA